MLHATLKWPEHYNKHLWPLAMSYAVHLHNHTPRREEGLNPIEIWSRTRRNYSHLKNSHPWGVQPMCYTQAYRMDLNFQSRNLDQEEEYLWVSHPYMPQAKV